MALQVAAYIANGKVVTGVSHFFALQKLNEEQKNGDLISGFIDPVTNIFSDDSGGRPRLLKHIFLLRHAESDGQDIDSPITDTGRMQAQQAALFFLKCIDLTDMQCFSSTALRCKQTSTVFEKEIKIKFTLNESLLGQGEEETKANYFKRLNHVLLSLPQKSLLISHSDLIINLSMLAVVGSNHTDWATIPNCSFTQIDNSQLIWTAKSYEKRIEC